MLDKNIDVKGNRMKALALSTVLVLFVSGLVGGIESAGGFRTLFLGVQCRTTTLGLVPWTWCDSSWELVVQAMVFVFVFGIFTLMGALGVLYYLVPENPRREAEEPISVEA